MGTVSPDAGEEVPVEFFPSVWPNRINLSGTQAPSAAAAAAAATGVATGGGGSGAAARYESAGSAVCEVFPDERACGKVHGGGGVLVHKVEGGPGAGSQPGVVQGPVPCGRGGGGAELEGAGRGGSKGGAFMSVHSKCVGSRHAGAAGGHVYGGEKSMIGRGWVDGWQSGRGGRGRRYPGAWGGGR